METRREQRAATTRPARGAVLQNYRRRRPHLSSRQAMGAVLALALCTLTVVGAMDGVADMIAGGGAAPAPQGQEQNNPREQVSEPVANGGTQAEPAGSAEQGSMADSIGQAPETPATAAPVPVPPQTPASDDLPEPPRAEGPFDLPLIYTGVTQNVWPGANGSPENGQHLYGLSYSPFGGMDNIVCPPFNETGGMCLAPNQVKNDMDALAKLTKRIKTYSSVCIGATRQIFESAREHGMTILMGVWIEDDVEANLAEFDRMIYFVRQYQDVVTDILVGNEPIFVIGLEPSFVAESVRFVRDKLKNELNITNIPIGVADIYNTWMSEVNTDDGDSGIPALGKDVSSVVEEVDWIGLNSHSYWGGVDPKTGRAAEHVFNGALQIANRWAKPVIITETGYPTVGEDRTTPDGTAETGTNELSLFVNDIEMLSRERGFAVYFFEPYNGDWKRRWAPFVELDYSFGLAHCNRTMKDITLPPLGAL